MGTKLLCEGAQRTDNGWRVPPEALTVVTEDRAHPLYDERADPSSPGHKSITEAEIEEVLSRGIVRAITVRRNGYARNGEPILEVVDGRTRTRTAWEANKRLRQKRVETITVKVDIIQSEDPMGDMIRLNERTKKDDPMTLAKKLTRYLDQGRTLDQAAQVFNRTKARLKLYQTLMDLDPVVQSSVHALETSLRVASELVLLPRSEQVTKLVDLRGAGQLSGSAAGREEAGKEGRKRKNKGAYLKPSKAEALAARDALELGEAEVAEMAPIPLNDDDMILVRLGAAAALAWVHVSDEALAALPKLAAIVRGAVAKLKEPKAKAKKPEAEPKPKAKKPEAKVSPDALARAQVNVDTARARRGARFMGDSV